MAAPKPQQLLKIFAVVMAALLAVAFSPLTDGDTGWKNTVGDVVWTGMFITFAAIAATAVWAALTAARIRG